LNKFIIFFLLSQKTYNVSLVLLYNQTNNLIKFSEETMKISKTITLTKNTVINEDITFTGSGQVILGSNVTLTINGNVTSPSNKQVFQYTDNTSKILGINNPIVYASWWGANPNDDINDTKSFQYISQYINDHDGGHLELSGGTYLVGIQNKGVTNAYQEEPIISILDTINPVIIDGQGAIIKRIEGLRYGSFDPNTGLPVNHPDYGPAPNHTTVEQYGFYDYQYQSSFAQGILYFRGNQNITLQNLAIDGNALQANIGGYFSDVYQVMGGIGLAFWQNEKATITNVASYNNLSDGILIAYQGQLAGAPNKPHTLLNVSASYNGRSGFSWTGGNGLYVENSDFNHNSKGIIVSPPGAGVDIEPENTILSNGYFKNVRFINNAGAGILIDSNNVSNVTFEDCLFWGTTYYPVYIRKDNTISPDDKLDISIINSDIYGTTLIDGVQYDTPDDSLLFQGVNFYAENPNGETFLVFGDHLIEAGHTHNVQFVDSTAYSLNPDFGYFGGSEGNIFNNFQVVDISP
jgi:hypothetical protein